MNTRNINSKFPRMLIKNTLGNSITASVWILDMLFQLGEITVRSFLSPSIYADLPEPLYSVLGTSTPKKPKLKFKETNIRQSIRRLQKYGFVQKKSKIYILTRKGKLLKEQMDKRKSILNQKWDNKYRAVIFDIPEEKGKMRYWLRQELYLLKYQKLQKSVFIGKYPLPRDLIKEIKSKGIGNYVNYLLVEKVYQNIL